MDTSLDLSRIAQLVLGAFLVVTGVSNVTYWARHRFWLPRYVHVIAAAAALLGLGMVPLIPESAPVREWGWPGDVFTVGLFPALVYATFVWYGGPKAALDAASDPDNSSESEGPD